MATINTNIANSSADNRSFALLRTNPKLTTNVKLMVDSNGEIFLSSFRASKELSKIKYQKYPLSEWESYSDDIAAFYSGLSSTEKYSVLKVTSDTSVFSDYKFQYEDQYQYGAIHNITKVYDEQYKIFAPIWLEKKIPTNFVVYRIEDANYSSQYAENVQGQNDRIKELLKNATIVKTFDLSKSSKIGKYLNNHVNNKLFPESAITFNFSEGSQSTFNGIDLINGGFTTKAEQLDKYYTQVDYPEIFNNETITHGFERNEIAIANIINLEFLFDDEMADDYNIYRYFGIYVDALDEGYFTSEGMTPAGAINVNADSYNTIYNVDSVGISHIDMFPHVSDFDIPQIRWVKDKDGSFYNLKGAINTPYNRLIISPNKNAADKFIGFAKNGKSVVALNNTPNNRGFIKLTVVDVPSANDRIFIGDKTEIEISEYNLGDYVIIADSSILPGRANGNKFSNQGSLQQIAIAISTAIRNGEIVTYKTYVDGTSVIIEDYASGNRRRQNALGIYNANTSNFIDIDNGELNDIGLVDAIVPISTSTLFSEWTIYTMTGGSENGQCILVDRKEIGNVSVGEWVKVKDSNTFIQIIEIEKDPFNTDLYRVVLSLPTKVSNDNTFEVYERYVTSHGRFSAYDFKDFDFDFYSTRNSAIGDLVYDEYDGVDMFTFYDGLGGVLESERIEEVAPQSTINNEYDRLNENELKETATLSRIIPTICKFELKDSSNARNLPYILNANEAFGEDNLSPNIEISAKRKVEYMNMEHFHINKIPSSHYGAGKELNNYMDFAWDGGITINKLTDTSFDYFERHFNWNGYYDPIAVAWVDNKVKRLWSKFDAGNNERNSSAVFRGLRYSYLKRKENLKDIPTEFINDSTVSDYKFGVVFNYNKTIDSEGNTILGNEVKVYSVKNDKFKFICVFVELNMVNNDVEFLDRYLLYTLNDITLGGLILDTNIPFLIDFSNSISNPSDNSAEWVLNASEFAVLDGTARFSEYITENNVGEYSWITFDAGGDTYGAKVIGVVNDESVLIDGWPWLWDNATNTVDISETRLNPSQFSLIPINSTFTYVNGGVNGFGAKLDEINAYNFANRFNQYGSIEYITIANNGSVTLNDYVLSIESGTDIIKPSLIRSETDPDRPKAYKLSSSGIGSVITAREDGGYVTLLRRMNGAYNPLFNPVVTFYDVHTENKIVPQTPYPTRDKLIYGAFNEMPITFDSHRYVDESYGYINNYFFHKVNAEDSKNILKLSQTSDKPPLYPKIGEVGIDKKQINVFKSKYAADYFTKALTGISSELVNGTLSPVEKKVFMSSTIMKVKNTYDITRYTNVEEVSIESLDKIRLNKLNTESIHWYESDEQVIIDVYLGEAILAELIEDGISSKFRNYVKPENSYGDKTTLEDDLAIYVDSNISPRFIIDNITIYGIEEKNIETDFYSTKYVSELTDGGFKPLTNYNIQSYQNEGLNFRLIYNKRRGYSYNFKLHVKIQA